MRTAIEIAEQRPHAPVACIVRDPTMQERLFEVAPFWNRHLLMIKDWNNLYSRVRDALMRRGRSEHDADDLIQEAWVRLACHECEHEVAVPEAFLMQTALNLSKDWHRRCVNHGDVSLDEEHESILDTRPNPEAMLLSKERLLRLSEGLARLNPKTREILLAHRLDGLMHSEIAKRESLTVSSIEKHVAKVTLLLAEWMEGY